MALTVRYELIRPKAGSPAAIMLVFNYSGQRMRASTKEYVYPEHWDKKDCRVPTKHLRAQGDYLELNRRLDNMADFVKQTYNQHRRDLTLPGLTPDVLKAQLLERFEGKPPAQAVKVVEYCQRLLADRQTSGHVAQRTLDGEASTIRAIIDFERKRGRAIEFKDVNLALFEEFRDYYWQKGGTVDSSIHKNLRRFRQFLLHAEASGIQMGGSVLAITLKSQLGLSSRARDSIALNEADLTHLANLSLTGADRLARIRDLFLCGCYTGLRVNQWGEITKDNLVEHGGTKMLELFTTKGRRKSITIPLHPVLQGIFEAHGWNMPRVPSARRINIYLKELCQRAGFTEEIELAQNVGGRSQIRKYQRWELVTTHTARRSFATNAHAAGLSIEDIQALTGHADRKILLHYIKEDGRLRAKRLGGLDFFKPK